MDKKLPRGFRNNNPGNLVQTAIKWKGKVAITLNTDGRFEQFTEFKYGLRAMIMDVRSDIKKGGQNTIKKLIGGTEAKKFKDAYAPPFENNTVKYIHDVCKITGLKEDHILDPSNQCQMSSLIRAMVFKENGMAISDAQFNEAWAIL